jgi:hypothetical protein
LTAGEFFIGFALLFGGAMFPPIWAVFVLFVVLDIKARRDRRRHQMGRR